MGDGRDEMGELAESIKTAVESWDSLGWPRPQVAVVSGSGLGVPLGEPERGPLDLSYFLPFAAHPVEGHHHQVELLRPLPNRRVVYLRGRLHAYQGYDAHQTVFPVRLAAQLGARVLILTNASGALRAGRRAGDLVLVRDHLNLTGLNPLRGELPPEWGPRFPDMSAAYDPRLAALAHRLADEQGLTLGEGVYAGLLGPSYETPAEVRMLGALGADLAGMSTVLEVIAARHLGLACLCLSLVSNAAAGVGSAAADRSAAGVGSSAADPPAAAAVLTHADVLAAARDAGARLQRLLGALIASPELDGAFTIGAGGEPAQPPP